MADVSDRMGYQNQAADAKPVHSAPATAVAPGAGGKQLNADQGFDIGGIGTALLGRTAHFVGGIASGRGSMPGGMSLPGMGGGGAAEGAEGAAGAAGAGEAAAGAGEAIGELAPLALAL